MKKGFTLVELLGVIILLALITGAIVTPIVNQINKTSTKLGSAAEKLLFSTLDEYLLSNSNTYKKENGSIYYITIEELMQAGVLEDSFILSNDDVLTLDTQIKIFVSNNSFVYEIPDVKLENLDSLYDDMDNETNYILYNGIRWRLLNFEREVEYGKIKEKGSVYSLVTDEPVTSLYYGTPTTKFEESYIYSWLNNYFASRLKYTGILDNNASYVRLPYNDELKDVSIPGLYSLVYTYNNNVNQYTGALYSETNKTIETTNYDAYMAGIRPIISVFGSAVVTYGNGTKENPYVLEEVKTSKINKTLGQANLSIGDFIYFDGWEYRIIDTLEDKVKVLIWDGHEPQLYGQFGTTSALSKESALMTRIENDRLTYFSDRFLSTNIYTGTLTDTHSNVLGTALSKKNIIYDVYLAPLKLGELFTTAIFDSYSDYYTMTPSSPNEVYKILDDSRAVSVSVSADENSLFAGYISLDEVITDGNGTESNPYVLD